MSEAILNYVKRVKECVELVKDSEAATKQSLIGPLFTILGYDLTDPRECVPEYRAYFGPDRSVKPIDWAFLQNTKPIFLVEAKAVDKRLSNYDEQLADYYAKSPEAKLGILTNGVQWRFFTDIVHSNVMDKEPFLIWDVIVDENPPFDFLTLLDKSQYSDKRFSAFLNIKALRENLEKIKCNKDIYTPEDYRKEYRIIQRKLSHSITMQTLEGADPAVLKFLPSAESLTRVLHQLTSEKRVEAWARAIVLADGKMPKWNQVNEAAREVAPDKVKPARKLRSSTVTD